MKLKDSYTLAELASHLNAELRGNASCEITGIAPLSKAQMGQITFLTDTRHEKFLASTQASAVIIDAKYAQAQPVSHANVLIMKNPALGYAKTAALFDRKSPVSSGVHPTAIIGQNCQIHPSAFIATHCIIGDNVTIGEHSHIYPNTTIGDNSIIGSHCQIWSNVSIYHQVSIGNRNIIHSGAVIGSDGFGMVNDNGTWHKIPQLGGVRTGDDVEIGANTTIDRGALEDTVIENGVKLDNLIQVAHNVHIGAHTVIAACSAIAGSTHIGKYCMFGGAVCINGHIEIADNVILTATTAVSSSITEPGVYSSGVPPQPNQAWRKNAVRFMQLDDLARRVRKLEKDAP
jgi:UDP-3-O-[3-hydroxymyristoyl] glucosamine N-acyltransferase